MKIQNKQNGFIVEMNKKEFNIIQAMLFYFNCGDMGLTQEAEKILNKMYNQVEASYRFSSGFEVYK